MSKSIKKYLREFGLIFITIQCSCFQIGCQSIEGFTKEEVSFRNEIDGAVLAGTLTIPRGQNNFPVAILISGAGLQDRDETVFGHKPFKALAEYLSQNGIAVLRFDDRGVGGSTGDVWNATIDVLAGDAYAGVQYLKTRKDIESQNIGLIGHSLGAMQGTILASKYPDIDFLVMLGGIGIAWSENHIKADRISNRLKGNSDEIIEAGSQLLRPLLKAMETAQDYQSARITAIQIIEEWQSSLTGNAAESINIFTESNPDFWTKSIADEYATPIYLSCARFEPIDYLTKIECPVLSIIGGKDIQVVPENSVAIENALKIGGNKNYTISTPEDINHIFQKCETGLISEYEKIDEDFNHSVMAEILDWINIISQEDGK